MEGVSRILLDGLEKAGVSIPVGVSNLSDIGSAYLVSICSQAVHLLNDLDSSFAAAMSDSMTSRVRLCNELADAIAKFGYPEEISFHELLYPSEEDICKILRFLLERLSQASLPLRARSLKEPGFVVSETSEGNSIEESENLESKIWFSNGIANGSETEKCPETTETSEERYGMVLVDDNCSSEFKFIEDKGTETLSESPQEAHGIGIVGKPHFDSPRKDRQCRGSAKKIEELASLTMQASQMEAVLKEMQSKESFLQKRLETKELETKCLEEDSLLLREAVNLAFDAEHPEIDNLTEIKKRVEARKKEISDLERQRDADTTTLEEEKAGFEELLEMRKSRIQKKCEELKAVEQEIKLIGEKIFEREGEEAALYVELSNSVKGATRSSYLERIQELTKNSKKQDTDLARIMHETHELQREYNSIEERLHRTYALVDEIVFRDAKTDPICRQIYRTLTTIHHNFSETIENMFSIAKSQRETAEYEAKLETLRKKQLDMLKVQHDLDDLWKENEKLEKELKNMSAELQD
eukprot:TRINITY_DN1990_c0_g1_i1.p1 TRINITY_DN1990_c0_g1~~TRINITY_DN1990_c0_g1_i1.p1  ORF type:complete len:527 (+),score=128.60 TRINITY_DN1990_c0_g1_i1:201-1781(+)